MNIWHCNRIVTLFIILTSLSAQSQKNEFGITAGGTYYMGDLNPNMHFAMSRIGGGAIYRRNINEHFAIRLNGLYGSVQANDAVIGYNTERNLNFRSSIIEISAQTEINFLPFINGGKDNPNSFYLLAGAGAFRFNPKADVNGQWIELRPLGTEGQGSELYPDRQVYSKYSYVLIFGVGMKFVVSERMSVGIEWAMRRTGTDYLDDVSTTYTDPSILSDAGSLLADRSENNSATIGSYRGNPYTKDWYSFAGLTITYNIKNPSNLKCPVYN